MRAAVGVVDLEELRQVDLPVEVCQLVLCLERLLQLVELLQVRL
jgi:hypothetical protein